MIPGSDSYYNCPNCGHLLSKPNIMSGNTCGAKLYSDGKHIAPMLPEYPNLTKCRKCNTFFWLSKLEEVQPFRRGAEQNSDWLYADRVKFLKIDELFDALKSGIAESKLEERIIRMEIWWAYNDRKRNDQELFINENDEMLWKENFKGLMDLLDDSEINDKITAAEIHRNLGNFKECLDIMYSLEEDEINWLKEKFICECNLKNKYVFQLY